MTADLLLLLRAAGLPPPETEYRFAAPERRWRVDYCYPAARLAIECEGGAYILGRHNRPSGFLKDMEKYNELACRGFRLIRFTPGQLADDPAAVVDVIRRALEKEV